MTATPPTPTEQKHTDTGRPSLRRTRNGRRWALGIVGGALALGLVAGGWAAYNYGPQFGVYVIPPSPERYADIALDIMDNGYYAEGPEWLAARSKVKEAAAEATTLEQLHAPLALAAAVAGGKHSFFLSPDEAAQSSESATENFAPPKVTSEGGITTVTVPALGSVSIDQQDEYAATAALGIEKADPGTCGWIIDLRGNTGGNMYPMLSGVSPLLPNGLAMSFLTRGGTETVVTVQDDGAGIGGNTTTAIPEIPKISDRPVAVLQDEQTGSSGEAVLTAFRGLDHVQSFGSPSAGYSSANSTHTLYDGALLVLTDSVYVDRDGVSLEERAIAPGVEAVAGFADRAAIDWLGQQGCN